MEPPAAPGFAQIEVGAPLSRAWEHMKEMLFPFDFTRWISLGLIAFLATLGSGGGARSLSKYSARRGMLNAVPDASSR